MLNYKMALYFVLSEFINTDILNLFLPVWKFPTCTHNSNWLENLTFKISDIHKHIIGNLLTLRPVEMTSWRDTLRYEIVELYTVYFLVKANKEFEVLT
jgi:hypothetical protein